MELKEWNWHLLNTNCVPDTVLGALIVISYYPKEPCEVGAVTYLSKMCSVSGRDVI